jgi:hypothetical protein
LEIAQLTSADEEKREYYDTQTGYTTSRQSGEPLRDRYHHDDETQPAAGYEPLIERRGKVIHRHTNSGAVVAIIVGILILVVGLYIVFTRLTLLAPSYANVGFLIVGIILLAIGAKIISSKKLIEGQLVKID